MFIWLWINTYRYILLWDEHPFATYFDVHQGYMVLTHCHMFKHRNGMMIHTFIEFIVFGAQPELPQPELPKIILATAAAKSDNAHRRWLGCVLVVSIADSSIHGFV